MVPPISGVQFSEFLEFLYEYRNPDYSINRDYLCTNKSVI